MCFPRKFKKRLELKSTDVVLPNEVWVTYSVCGCDPDACGWEGWILESAAKKSGKKKQQLYVLGDNCPQCGKNLFRTAATLRFTVSKNQVPDLVPGVDYRVARAKYI